MAPADAVEVSEARDAGCVQGFACGPVVGGFAVGVLVAGNLPGQLVVDLAAGGVVIQGMPGSSAPAANEDPVAVLGKLKQLLDAGLVTPAEYEAKKAERRNSILSQVR